MTWLLILTIWLAVAVLLLVWNHAATREPGK